MKKLALLSGVNEYTFHNILHNRTSPTVRVLRKISPILNESISYLGCYDLLPEDTLGQKITKARLCLGMTQVEFAKFNYVDPSTLLKWEHDESVPNSENLEKLKLYL